MVGAEVLPKGVGEGLYNAFVVCLILGFGYTHLVDHVAFVGWVDDLQRGRPRGAPRGEQCNRFVSSLTLGLD